MQMNWTLPSKPFPSFIILPKGTHTLCKTYFSLCAFSRYLESNVGRNGQPSSQIQDLFKASMQNDAHHLSHKMTALYLGSSSSSGAYNQRYADDEALNEIPPYKSIYSNDLHLISSNFKSLKLKQNKKTLYGISQWFIFNVVQIDCDHFNDNRYTIAELVNLVTSYKPPIFPAKKKKINKITHILYSVSCQRQCSYA